VPDVLTHPDGAPDGPPDEEVSTPRRRAGLVAAAVVFVAIAAFWIWILVYQLQNRGEEDMLDRLDDLSWTSQADEICAATTERIAELPMAPSVESASERADVIEVATAEVEAMLVELESIAPTGDSDDARITAAWIADYRVFLQDRLDYAATLRVDPSARFLVTEKYGSHITKPIDRFARVNEMEACMSPTDV
jgi:hypothetical protein